MQILVDVQNLDLANLRDWQIYQQANHQCEACGKFEANYRSSDHLVCTHCGFEAL